MAGQPQTQQRVSPLDIDLFGLGQRAVGHVGDIVLEDLRLEGDVGEEVVLGDGAGGGGGWQEVGLRVVRLLIGPAPNIRYQIDRYLGP